MKQALEIKICGLTRREDVLQAAALGARALGFVFAPSLRRVEPSHVPGLCRDIAGAPLRFGVFVNASLEEIAAALRASAVNGIQLHGQETPAFVREVKRRFPEHALMKACSPAAPAEEFSAEATLLLEPPRLLCRPLAVGDAPCPLPTRPYFIAGGLSAENLGSLVRAFRPTGVDVASGVELAPGIKCREKLRHFFARAREIEL